MKPPIKRLLLWVIAAPVVVVTTLWAYSSVPITAPWAEFGYYGQFNQVQKIIRSIPGLKIVDHRQHHDVIMEDFSFTVSNMEGTPFEINFWENTPQMKLTKDADIRHYIVSVVASHQ